MSKNSIKAFGASLLLGCLSLHGEMDVLEVMHDELRRSFDVLQNEEVAPYYLSYEITQDETLSVSGSYGAVLGESEGAVRFLDIDLRVGEYELDNTHPTSSRTVRSSGASSVSVSSPEALRSTLWYRTDSKYREAVTQLTSVKSAIQSSVEEEDQSGDFSSAPQEEFRAEYVALNAELEAFKERVRALGAPFKHADHIIFNSVRVSADVETRWFVNSEGSKIRMSEPYYNISINASAKADDGMILPRYVTYVASSFDKLPDDETILADVHEIIANLAELREAPLVDPYEGPAILSGRATGVFFHEILGHRLEGHRQKFAHEGQTFKAKLGESILPESFSVIFDPNVRQFENTELQGSYHFDNEGVKGRRVTTVENGVLTGFLMSRMPIDGFPMSNGHGRKNFGRAVVARQSNMFVEVKNPLTPEQLRERLLDKVRNENKEFGLYFKDIQGGFTITQRSLPNAFNVQPILVYRLYEDGREELVRGVTLIGTPLTTFSRVEAGANDYEVFNGICGAESGSVPVSAIAPSILVSQIEVQKINSSRSLPPILPSPVGEHGEQTINYIEELR